MDAVCINQEDIEERNSQVAMMRQIYQEAKREIIWLGSSTAETAAGMLFIPRLLAAEQKAKELIGDDKIDLSQGDHYGQDPKRLGLPRGGANEYHAFISLIKADWFSRVWILQEVALAKETRLSCGTHTVSFEDFEHAFFFFNAIDMIIPAEEEYASCALKVMAVIDARSATTQGHPRDLLGTLLRCRPSLATDPRDKVFGLLGLTTDTGPKVVNVQVDYNHEMKQVYFDTAFAIIKFEQKLDVLGVPRIANSTSQSLPSWVPDWTKWESTTALNRRDRPASDADSKEVLVRQAVGDSKALPEISSDRSMLGLQGCVIDSVTEMGDIFTGEDGLVGMNTGLIDIIKQFKQNTQALLQWEHVAEARSGKKYAPTGEEMLVAYWQTITAGWEPPGSDLSTEKSLEWDAYHRPGASLRQRAGFKTTTSSAFGWLTVGANVAKQTRRPPPKSDFDRCLQMSWNRRLVRSKNGYVGLAPAATVIGNAIALFKGGGSPLIVRREQAHWKLVGDSYVHGMMNGECFREQNCNAMWLL